MASKTEELMNLGTVVKTAKGELTVKALSVNEIFELSKMLADQMTTLMELATKYSSKGSVIHPDFILGCLISVPKLFVVVDKSVEKEEGFCGGLSLADLTDVILVIMEVNDLPRIVRNFSSAKLQIQKVMATEKT